MADQKRKNRRLQRRLKGKGLVIAPGVFDLISARVADRLGFGALYVSSGGVAASHLGAPDAGIATYTDMVERVRQIAARTETPLIGEAETGYGSLANVRETVRGYEAAGASGVQLEDQEVPKKSGHRVVPVEEMVAKIRIAVESRADPDLVIVARTDACITLGLEEALHRGDAYVDAGADVLFVESPTSEAELQAIGGSFEVPLVASMVHTGVTPILPHKKLAALGFKVVLYPAVGLLAAAAALERAYRGVLDGGPAPEDLPLYELEAFNRLMGLDEVRALEERHGIDPPKRRRRPQRKAQNPR